jgi:hypothetical protein
MHLRFPVLALLVLITGLVEEHADADVPLLAAKAVAAAEAEAEVTVVAVRVIKLFDIY